MGQTVSASGSSSSSSTPLLLAPTRCQWVFVTDGTARGGATVLSISSIRDGPEDGALKLQGSLGALEAADGKRLVGFAIAECPLAAPICQDTSTQGLRLSYRHDPSDAHFQLRLLAKGLAPQESFVAPLPPLSSSSPAAGSVTATIPWSAFRLQYRGRLLEERAGERVDPCGVTSVGIETTRSSQPPPLYARVPLPFQFVLLPPGIEGVP